MIRSTLWATGWLVWASTTAIAQGSTDLNEQKAQALALEKQLPVPNLTPKASFDLSPARQEHFQKYLPKAYRKLTQREPFHLLVLGDAPAFQIQSSEGKGTDAFPGVFANHLANQFYYTGGAQESKGAVAAEVPTITLRTLAQTDGSVFDAAAILESTARQSPVDVVLICYGQNDVGMQPPTFARAIAAALAGAREIGAEVILCSPWLPVADRSESVMGQNRPLSDVLQETAAELGVLHVDLGDLSRLLSIPSVQSQDEGVVFERIERTYREFFHQGADGTFTPRPSLHRQLGALVYKDLLEPRSPLPWQITKAHANQVEDGKLTLSYTLKNVGPKDLALTALPLIANGWKPVEAKSTLTLKSGESQDLSVSYAAQSTVLPLQEALLRQPVLVSTDTIARVETLRTVLEPITVVWGLETLFNQESVFLVNCQIVNPDKSTVQGTWEAEFSGQKLKGTLNLKSEGVEPLNLRFDLPKDTPSAAALDLKLSVRVGDQTLTSTRQVRLTRNLGLNQSVPLSTARSASAITLTPKATANELKLTFDLPTDLLQEAADGSSPAWQIELNLDARSYGKRLEAGSTAALRATGKSLDGPGKVHAIPAWAFGTGYAANFDPKEFKTGLSTAGDKRQLTLTLPRTYLYLHEWALENGNSQLGINVRLTLNGPEGYATYALNPGHKPTQDVESLSVLELTAQPTQRVTVNVE